MKRILIASFLFIAVCTVVSVQRLSAQVTHIAATDFTTQVNLLDSYIAAGNTTAAQTEWTTVHNMMIAVLSYTKNSIKDAATEADKASYRTIMTNQRDLYQTIWTLKSDLTANRAALHSKLGEFDLTIY